MTSEEEANKEKNYSDRREARSKELHEARMLDREHQYRREKERDHQQKKEKRRSEIKESSRNLEAATRISSRSARRYNDVSRPREMIVNNIKKLCNKFDTMNRNDFQTGITSLSKINLDLNRQGMFNYPDVSNMKFHKFNNALSTMYSGRNKRKWAQKKSYLRKKGYRKKSYRKKRRY